MNTYLIAYITPNDRVLTKRVTANSQTEVIMLFELHNPSCTIIAITNLGEY